MFGKQQTIKSDFLVSIYLPYIMEAHKDTTLHMA